MFEVNNYFFLKKCIMQDTKFCQGNVSTIKLKQPTSNNLSISDIPACILITYRLVTLRKQYEPSGPLLSELLPVSVA